jgi:hypothetical protein
MVLAGWTSLDMKDVGGATDKVVDGLEESAGCGPDPDMDKAVVAVANCSRDGDSRKGTAPCLEACPVSRLNKRFFLTILR